MEKSKRAIAVSEAIDNFPSLRDAVLVRQHKTTRWKKVRWFLSNQELSCSWCGKNFVFTNEYENALNWFHRYKLCGFCNSIKRFMKQNSHLYAWYCPDCQIYHLTRTIRCSKCRRYCVMIKIKREDRRKFLTEEFENFVKPIPVNLNYKMYDLKIRAINERKNRK